MPIPRVISSQVLLRIRCGAIGFFVLAVTWCAASQAAVHTVSFSNGVDPATVVCDGSPDDLDLDPDEIEVHFTLADGINDDWVASGVILATTTDPNGATLVVTETTIQNVTGNQVIGAQILVQHDFSPVVTLSTDYVAHIDGSFDKVGGGVLGNLILSYGATMTGASLGGTNFMGGLVLVPPAVLFNWTGSPVHQDTIIQQRQDFIFYIDELDNTINLFNSATIMPSTTVSVQQAPWGAIKGLFR